jgi:hypothetical protein
LFPQKIEQRMREATAMASGEMPGTAVETDLKLTAGDLE